MGCRHTFVCLIVSCIWGAAIAEAQPADSVAAAEQLFNEARALSQAGRHAEACPKFEASYRLDPALGTLLNLATCYEKNGQLASAWGRYRELVLLATKSGDKSRLMIGNERSAALEPRLPKLTIKAPAEPIAELVVSRDQILVDPGVIGTAIYVDPGRHVVRAEAPGRVPYTTEVELGESESKEVVLPALALLPKQDPLGQKLVTREVDLGVKRRRIGMIVGAGGLVGVAAGLVVGATARKAWNGAFDDGLCDRDTLRCTPDGQAQTDKARDRALISSIATGAGAALVAAGAILYFTAPGRTTIQVSPTSDGGAVSFGARW